MTPKELAEEEPQAVSEIDALAEKAFTSPGIQTLIAEDALTLQREKAKKLAEEFRKKAKRHSQIADKFAEMGGLGPASQAKAKSYAFEQAAQMVEENLL